MYVIRYCWKLSVLLVISPKAESFKREKNENREIRKDKDIQVQDILAARIVENPYVSYSQ